jgi:hypothetical protein
MKRRRGGKEGVIGDMRDEDEREGKGEVVRCAGKGEQNVLYLTSKSRRS